MSAILIYIIIVVIWLFIHEKTTTDIEKEVDKHQPILIVFVSIWIALALWAIFIVPKDTAMKQKDYYIHQLFK